MAVSAPKARGAIFTSPDIADFLAAWALRRAPTATALDPHASRLSSCSRLCVRLSVLSAQLRVYCRQRKRGSKQLTALRAIAR